MSAHLDIAFFESSLVSAYWNDAATYYRGIVRALHERGNRITFYEPDAFDRRRHGNIEDPSWARVVVYQAEGTHGVSRALDEARQADVIIKTSGVGVVDEYLETAVLELRGPRNIAVFWDVDAPATIDRLDRDPGDPFRDRLARFDLLLTYGGGRLVIDKYEQLGARLCLPIYDALDPFTHYQVDPDSRFRGALGFLGNRLPDRELRVEEFFLGPACHLHEHRFVLGGSGWTDKPLPRNVKYAGHVPTRDHNAFNSSPMAILNINRDSMARFGFSPPSRIFEAAGASACIISDRWEGIELFLEPDHEVLVADSGAEIAAILLGLTGERAVEIGRNAFRRIIADHTYSHRAAQVESVLTGSHVLPLVEP